MHSVNDKNIVNLSDFTSQAKENEYAYVDNLDAINEADANEFVKVGIETDAALRAGTFIQKNNAVVHCSNSTDGADVMGMAGALEAFPWLEPYVWKLLSPEKDDMTREAAKSTLQGFFIRSHKGVKIEKPLQTCLHIAQDKFSQKVHNIVIAEEDSEVHIIAGCSTSPI